MASDTGTLLPWGLIQGANFPGDRARYALAQLQSQRAAGLAYRSLGWQEYGLGRVTSPLDTVRVNRPPTVIEEKQSTTGSIPVAGI